jgi:hypothetical protein
MPVLSMFYGIIIRMYQEIGSRHNLPHFHAVYAEKKIVIDLEGNTLEGSLPIKQYRLLMAWFELHREELNANWDLLTTSGEYFKIKPLD